MGSDPQSYLIAQDEAPHAPCRETEARLLAALGRIHKGASRTAQDSRSRDDDRYCLADVIDTSGKALAGDDSALKAALQAEHSKAIKTLAEAWRKVVPEFVLNLQIEHLMQPLEAPSTAAEKIRAAFDATLNAARHDGRMDQVADDAMAWQRAEQTEQERDFLRAQLAERDAQVERLREFIERMIGLQVITRTDRLNALLAETPAASFAAVREQARREALTEAAPIVRASILQWVVKAGHDPRSAIGDWALNTADIISEEIRELATRPAKEPSNGL